MLGRDDVLALALDVLQGSFENRDVLPDGHERSLGPLDQAGQALLHDPAIDDTERARHEIRNLEHERDDDVLGPDGLILGVARSRVEHAARRRAQAPRPIDAGDDLLVEQGAYPLACLRGLGAERVERANRRRVRGRGEQLERDVQRPDRPHIGVRRRSLEHGLARRGVKGS